MKTLVVFYSRTGNTRRVGEAVARALGADMEEIFDKKKRSGFFGFLFGGRDSLLKNKAAIEPSREKASDYDLVVLGTPVWANNMTPAMRTYLSEFSAGAGPVAFFLTTGGSGINSTFAEMERLAGKAPLAKLAVKHQQAKKGDFAAEVEEFVSHLRGQIY